MTKDAKEQETNSRANKGPEAVTANDIDESEKNLKSLRHAPVTWRICLGMLSGALIVLLSYSYISLGEDRSLDFFSVNWGISLLTALIGGPIPAFLASIIDMVSGSFFWNGIFEYGLQNSFIGIPEPDTIMGALVGTLALYSVFEKKLPTVGGAFAACLACQASVIIAVCLSNGSYSNYVSYYVVNICPEQFACNTVLVLIAIALIRHLKHIKKQQGMLQIAGHLQKDFVKALAVGLIISTALIYIIDTGYAKNNAYNTISSELEAALGDNYDVTDESIDVEDRIQKTGALILGTSIMQTGEIYVFDNDLNIRYSSFGSYEELGDEYASNCGIVFDPETMSEADLSKSTGHTYVLNYDVYLTYIDLNGFYLVGAADASQDVMASRNISMALNMSIMILMGALIIVIINYSVSKKIISYISGINGGLEKITEGELETRIEPKPDNTLEFHELADGINQTVSKLKDLIAEADERVEKELQFAREIQLGALERVFPPFKDEKRFEIYAFTDPAKDVGGDFYDFFFIDPKTFAIIIADVSGKGIPAAMFMMAAKNVIKGKALSGMPVNEVLRTANDELCTHNDAGMFVTVWMAVINLETGSVNFSNGGHNPPLIKRQNGEFEYLKSKVNLVLAAMEGVPYSRDEIHFEPGDEIYLYTDGVTEATNKDNELYEEYRLKAVLNRTKAETSEGLLEAVRKDVDLFVGDAEQFDDITMMSFKYYGNNA